MEVNHEYVVTAPVVSEATGVVDVGPGSLANIFFTMQRRCEVVAPHTDNGSMPANRDKLLEIRAPLLHDTPLRLRGGNGEYNDNSTGEVVNGTTVVDTTPTNYRKRKAGDSPPGSVPEYIASENNNIEDLIRNCKTFLHDMQVATKVGRKWIQGIEDYLTKIHSCSTSIALEAAVISGKYQEARTESMDANKRLNECLQQRNITYATAIKRKVPVTMPGDDITAEDYPVTDRGPTNDRLGDYPTLDSHTSSNKNRVKSKKKTSKGRNQGKVADAMSRPVKPAFIVENSENKLTMECIWKAVCASIPKPKLDGCKKLANGNYVLTCSDSGTVNAIRQINDGLSIKESRPRKPRVKLRGVPIDYTPEFIAKSIITQNEGFSDSDFADIRPLFRCGKRNDFNSDWVIEVSPKIYSSINGKRTYVGMISTFPRPFNLAPYCRRCLLTDHKTSECKAESSSCLHCAEPGHNRSDCPNRNNSPRCAHCNGEHATLSKDCAKWARKTRALQLKTEYAHPNES